MRFTRLVIGHNNAGATELRLAQVGVEIEELALVFHDDEVSEILRLLQFFHPVFYGSGREHFCIEL